MSGTANILIDEKIIDGHLPGSHMWREEYPFFRDSMSLFSS